MTTTRAAKYLAPIDLGKTITATDTDTGKTVTGELQSIDAIDYNIELGIIAGKDSGEYRVNYDDEITITGKPSPTRQGEQPNTAYVRIEPQLAIGGEDQAQRTPPPIPAATAAAATIGHITLDELLGVHPGPACCTDDCCGPGSYCCTHPENAPHTHLELEEPEHRHLYISGRPACVQCGATDPNLGHYPDDDTNTGPTRQEDK